MRQRRKTRTTQNINGVEYQIIKNNQKIIENFIHKLELNELSEETRRNKVWLIYIFFKYINFKKAENVTQMDVENFFIWMKNNGRNVNTRHRYHIELNYFFKWLKPDNDFFINVNTKKQPKELKAEELVSEQESHKIIQNTRNTRDRALLHVMYDSAARLSEIINMKKSDVLFDQHGAKIKVNGKTGERYIRIVNSAPDLQTWMNQHTGTLNDYLFPVLPEMTKFSKNGVRNVLTAAVKRAGIEKKNNIYPHLLRHSKITKMFIAGMNETQLNPFAGWKKNSNMASVYVHLAESDIDEKVLELSGIEMPEKKKNKIINNTKTCPFCKTVNSFDVVICRVCSRVIDQTRAIDPAEQKMKEMEIRMMEVERDAYIRPYKVEIDDLKYNIEESKKILKTLTSEELKAEADKMLKWNGKIKYLEEQISQLMFEYKIKIDELKNS